MTCFDRLEKISGDLKSSVGPVIALRGESHRRSVRSSVLFKGVRLWKAEKKALKKEKEKEKEKALEKEKEKKRPCR